MRPSQSNPNSPFSFQNQTHLNENYVINLDEPNETHQMQPKIYSQNAFEKFGSSDFTNNFIETHLSIEPFHNPSPNEAQTQNHFETFVPNLEENEDDYSLSHIVGMGRNYISMVKDRSRNITRDNANFGVLSSHHDYFSCPLPYLNRSSTNLIEEQQQEFTRKRPYVGSSSSLRKDKNFMSSILLPPDHELFSNIDSDYKKWQEWQANEAMSKRARTVQDNEDFQHPGSFVGQHYTNLQTYSNAPSEDQVWNGRLNNSSNK